jgi:hypothetical protein
MPEPADSAPGPWAEEHDHPWATHSHPGGTSPHAHPAADRLAWVRAGRATGWTALPPAQRPAPGNGVPVSPSLVRVEEALTAWLDDLTSGTATRDAYVQALGRLTRAEYEEARTSGLLCSYWEKPRAAPAGPVPEPVS